MKPYIVALCISLLCLVAGCSTEGPYVPAERQPSPELENTAVILDKELKDSLGVDSQTAERTSQNKLKAMVNIRNRTNLDLTIQVQTVFRDLNGFSIQDDTSWETIVLTAHETRTVGATSTTPKADRFTVRLRMFR